MRRMTTTELSPTTVPFHGRLASDIVAPAGIECGTVRESLYVKRTFVLTLETSHCASKKPKSRSLPAQAGVAQSLQNEKWWVRSLLSSWSRLLSTQAHALSSTFTSGLS
jgi:hypothetical protein